MWASVAVMLIAYRLEYLCTLIYIFIGALLLSARFISPDIDMKNTTPYRNWGVFRHLLIPYAWLFSHRGMSHHPIWGPLTLIPYTFTCIAGIVAVFIIFCLPVVNASADYLCMAFESLQTGVMPPGLLKNFSIVVFGAVIAIWLHDIYDAIGKGDRQA
jgi:uncharacterized metal-binding protein